MVFWVYTCPKCGLQVRTDHQAVQLTEIKVCQCAGVPVESKEGE